MNNENNINGNTFCFPQIEYKKFLEILENVIWDRENSANPCNYIDNIKKAQDYISISADKSEYSILGDAKDELLRPLTRRETVCCFNCIEELNNKNYANAYHELLDMIEDYDRYKNKKYISVGECFLFMDLLTYFYNSTIKDVN